VTERTKEYAFLSGNSYDLKSGDISVKNGDDTFEVIARSAPSRTGFFGAAYRNEADNHIIIAYRGTQDLADGIADAGMVATRLNLQAIESEVFTAQVILQARLNSSQGTPADITVTGHSLGGGLAQLNAERYHLQGETFNAYGTVGLVSHRTEGGEQMINHVRAGDPVSAASGHYGEVRIYATADDVRNIDLAGYGYDQAYHPDRALSAISVSAHSMSNFIDDDKGHYSIINAQGEALYQSHREAIDQYRHDIRTSRELATAAIGHPVEAGLAVGTTVAPTLASVAAAPIIEGGRDVVRTAEAVERAASWTGHVATGALAPAGTATAIYGSETGSPEIDRRLRALSITNDDHPGHSMYKQALDGVEKLDDKHGREPDTISRNLAASLAVEGCRNGMTRIDHVVLSDDASRTYAVQGAMNSPHKMVASVQTELGISKSVEASSHEWSQAQSTATQVQQAAQTQAQTQQAAVRPHGP
jgi:hypothetical protein